MYTAISNTLSGFEASSIRDKTKGSVFICESFVIWL